jgi:hypothetical protein
LTVLFFKRYQSGFQNFVIGTRDRRKAGALLLTRRSGTLRRAEIFDGPVVRALRATPNQIHRSFLSGVARNARTRIGNHAVVIGRKNEEAIRLLSVILGLLPRTEVCFTSFVMTDELRDNTDYLF